MPNHTQQLLIQLKNENHLVVCQALKELASNPTPSDAIIESVFQLLDSTIIAVEKRALKTLTQFKEQALPIHLKLLSQFSRRLQAGGGCDYSCCGYQAYYAPVELYIETLLAVAGRKRIETALAENLANLEEKTSQEIGFLISEY